MSGEDDDKHNEAIDRLDRMNDDAQYMIDRLDGGPRKKKDWEEQNGKPNH